VAEVIEAVNKVSICNSVRLWWVPGHRGVPGNEGSGWPSETGARTSFISPALVFIYPCAQ